MRKKKPTLKSEIARLEAEVSQAMSDINRRILYVENNVSEADADVNSLRTKIAKMEVANKADGPIWQSAMGPIRMRDMTDGHLWNAIKFLEGKDGNKTTTLAFRARAMPKLTELKAEKKRREMMAAEEKKWRTIDLGPGKVTCMALDGQVFQEEKVSEFKVTMEGENPSAEAQATIKRQFEVNCELRREVENWKKIAFNRLAEAEKAEEKEKELRAELGKYRTKVAELSATLRRVRDVTQKEAEDWKALAQIRLEQIGMMKAGPYNPFRPGCE